MLSELQCPNHDPVCPPGPPLRVHLFILLHNVQRANIHALRGQLHRGFIPIRLNHKNLPVNPRVIPVKVLFTDLTQRQRKVRGSSTAQNIKNGKWFRRDCPLPRHPRVLIFQTRLHVLEVPGRPAARSLVPVRGHGERHLQAPEHGQQNQRNLRPDEGAGTQVRGLVLFQQEGVPAAGSGADQEDTRSGLPAFPRSGNILR